MFFTKKMEDKKSEESVLESLKTDVPKDTTIRSKYWMGKSQRVTP